MCVAFEKSVSVYEAFSIVNGTKMVEIEELSCLALNVELSNQEEALNRNKDAIE
jgi:hypothetical protein